MAVSVISAGRGEGKTTFLLKYAAREAERGRSIGGIASPAIFEGDQRMGYDLIDLRHNHRLPLARVTIADGSASTVGMYRFDDAAIARGNAAIVAAVTDGRDVIAIDEVGPLEFRGGGWAPALELALRECGSQQELIVVVRPVLVDELPTRFRSPQWAAARHISPPWPARMLA